MNKILPFILITIGLGGLAIADPDHNQALPPITIKQTGFGLATPNRPHPQKTESDNELKADEAAFAPYTAEVQRRIRRNWAPPTEDRNKHIVSVFQITRDGRLSGFSIQKSSGSPAADQAALAAIKASAPFRPLPPGYQGKDKTFQFTFDYEINGHGAASLYTGKINPNPAHEKPDSIMISGAPSYIQKFGNPTTISRPKPQNQSKSRSVPTYHPSSCKSVNASNASRDAFIAELYGTFKTGFKSSVTGESALYSFTFTIHPKAEKNPNHFLMAELTPFLKSPYGSPAVRMLDYPKYNYILMMQYGLKKSSGDSSLDLAGIYALDTLKKIPNFPDKYSGQCLDVAFPLK